MNVQQALKAAQCFHWVSSVDKIPNRGPKQKRWRVKCEHDSPVWQSEEYTDRGLIKFVQLFRGNPPQTRLKKNLKHFDHRKNRHRTRQKIQEERFEDIPQNKPVYREDVWNWD